VSPGQKLAVDPEVARVGVDLAVLKAKCGRLGLYATLHAIDDATKVYAKDVVDNLEHRARATTRKEKS
jgi:hypothetical protein